MGALHFPDNTKHLGTEAQVFSFSKKTASVFRPHIEIAADLGGVDRIHKRVGVGLTDGLERGFDVRARNEPQHIPPITVYLL